MTNRPKASIRNTAMEMALEAEGKGEFERAAIFWSRAIAESKDKSLMQKFCREHWRVSQAMVKAVRREGESNVGAEDVEVFE